MKRVHYLALAAILGALLLLVMALGNAQHANVIPGSANATTDGDINWPPILAAIVVVGGAVWVGLRDW